MIVYILSMFYLHVTEIKTKVNNMLSYLFLHIKTFWWEFWKLMKFLNGKPTLLVHCLYCLDIAT